MTNKTKKTTAKKTTAKSNNMKRGPVKPTVKRKRAAEPEDLRWLDESIHQAELNLARLLNSERNAAISDEIGKAIEAERMAGINAAKARVVAGNEREAGRQFRWEVEDIDGMMRASLKDAAAQQTAAEPRLASCGCCFVDDRVPVGEADIRKPKGAMRTGRKPMYHLVPIELMDAVAATRAYGDRKYAPGNWQQGDAAFFVDCLDHAIAHLHAVQDSPSEVEAGDHLGHAATNIAFLLWALKRQKITQDDFLNSALAA